LTDRRSILIYFNFKNSQIFFSGGLQVRSLFCKQAASDMESTGENIINYNKSKEYWEKIEPTNSGMLGNMSYLSMSGEFQFSARIVLKTTFYFSDITGSSNFLKQIYKIKPAPGRLRALDCGAGIGRITKNLLSHEFQTVDLLEQDAKFCEQAKENLQANSEQIGNIYNVGLQSFNEADMVHKYDCIWVQWVLIYLSDNDLAEFFVKISKCLSKNGIIVVKENYAKGDEVVYDKGDASVTRTLQVYKNIMKKANLRIIKDARQNHFPKELFPVQMFALRPTGK
jgi:protein N-terminal methyltransferase